jgi:hypothetical protein
MVDAEILGYYGHGLEQDRLRAGDRRIEFLRVWDLLSRHLPPAPARELILSALRLVEAEPSVLGLSQNFLAIAERPGRAEQAE